MNKTTWNNVGKILIVLLVLAGLGKIYVDKKIGSIEVPPKGDTGDETTPDGDVSFLKLPEGFKAVYFAKGVDGARVMEWDPKGRMLVSQTGEGKISVLEDADGDGKAEKVKVLIDKLDKPHGMAFKCSPVTNPECLLYIAQHGELSRYAYDAETATVSGYTKILDLPKSKTDRHFTRTLLFLGVPKDDTLLISVGSSCNVCHEKDDTRGKVVAYNVATKETKEYATGLRNAVFMTLDPVDGKVFLTEMARDGLGNDIPPDEINVIDPKISAVPNFGWPSCFGKNIHDDEFEDLTGIQFIRAPCSQPFEMPSWADLPAHVAPLGLAFISEEGWDENLWFDLLVAEHGSWNKSNPDGYKIVKIKTSKNGEAGVIEDFITGWLTSEGEKLGRPVDIKVMPGGVIYISDDLKGVVYRIERE